jgi:hypothetical protein
MGRTVKMNITAMLLVLWLLCQSTDTTVSGPTDIHVWKQRTPPMIAVCPVPLDIVCNDPSRLSLC